MMQKVVRVVRDGDEKRIRHRHSEECVMRDGVCFEDRRREAVEQNSREGSYSGKSGKSGSSGSLTACDNNVDIVNTGGSTFDGSDYTCDTSFNNSTGADLPKCRPCHPGCPSASKTSTRTRSLRDIVAKNQAEMDMEILYPMLN
jgi:hypothetical protein